MEFFFDLPRKEVHEHPYGLIGKFFALLAGLVLVSLVWSSVYNLYFHPLRHFPGPKLAAISRIPYTRNYVSGKPFKKILQLHQAYGPFVRLAPDILSVSHPDAMEDLRGHRTGGNKTENTKDPVHYFPFRHNILGANREDHTRFRRVMAHGFSAKAMLEQQPTIKQYVDLLFKRLHEKCGNGTQRLDMVKWYNWTTFDVIGDLSFGEPFGCLENANYHSWVALIFTGIKQLAFLNSMRRYRFLRPLVNSTFITKTMAAKQEEHNQLSEMKVRKRLSMPDRPDFIGKMVQGSKDKGTNMTFEELVANASILIIAGSETTATLLSAATYLLAKYPRALALLTEEVRSAFSDEEEINLLSTQHLKYLQAVLQESLRIYSPVPGTQPRVIPPEGDRIAGRFIPGNASGRYFYRPSRLLHPSRFTSLFTRFASPLSEQQLTRRHPALQTVVEIWQRVLFHDPNYFTLPDEFIPERWLGDERFKQDKLDAVQAFSVGPRNCIGKNLAYSEMRLILARMVWNFDIQMAEESKGWDEKSKLYLLWEKPPLEMYLTPRQKA